MRGLPFLLLHSPSQHPTLPAWGQTTQVSRNTPIPSITTIILSWNTIGAENHSHWSNQHENRSSLGNLRSNWIAAPSNCHLFCRQVDQSLSPLLNSLHRNLSSLTLEQFNGLPHVTSPDGGTVPVHISVVEQVSTWVCRREKSYATHFGKEYDDSRRVMDASQFFVRILKCMNIKLSPDLCLSCSRIIIHNNIY